MSTPTSVYRYYDADGALVYVGITARGIQRQNEHNAHAEWWPFVVRQDVEHYPDRDDAATRERELIQRFRPPFNKQHNDGCEALKAAYLAAHPGPKVASCDWDEECDMGAECVAFGGEDWCGKPECPSCHRAWHRYSSGYSDGYDQGEATFADALAWLCASDDDDVSRAGYQLREAMSRALNIAATSTRKWQADSLSRFMVSDENIQETIKTRRSIDEYNAAAQAKSQGAPF